MTRGARGQEQAKRSWTVLSGGTIFDRLPLAVMDASLRRVKIGDGEIRFVTAVNGGPIDGFDFRPERLALLQLRKGTLQLLGQWVDRGVVQPEAPPGIGNCRGVIAGLERRLCRPCQFHELLVKPIEDAQDPRGGEFDA